MARGTAKTHIMRQRAARNFVTLNDIVRTCYRTLIARVANNFSLNYHFFCESSSQQETIS